MTMSNTKEVLITLTPLDKFYFGGEMGFARNDKVYDEDFGSYVVKSNCFPQQSSLMGMLRYYLLQLNDSVFNGREITNKAVAKELIGENSFKINDTYEEINFGKIKSIGSCFIQYKIKEMGKWDNLISAPLDYDYEVSFENCKSLRRTEREKIPIVKGYDAKEGMTTKYIRDTLCVLKDELFCPDTRIGIDRDFDGNTKEGAYYKQTFFRFGNAPQIDKNRVKLVMSQDGFSARFAFHAVIEDNVILSDNIHIKLGGDNSTFNLCIEDPIDFVYSSKVSKVASGISKVVLLSDAFILPDELDKCLFCMNKIVSFRFLSTTIGVKNYTKFNTGELKRSDKYNLHQKGSVYFFDNNESMNEFTKVLKSKKCFRQIGYNQYASFKN